MGLPGYPGVYTKFSGRFSREPFPWLIQKFPLISIFKNGQPGRQLNLSEGQIRLDLTSGSVGNSHRSASPRPTTLEEDRELFVNFSLILCLWFEIQDLRAYNFFDWISNTDERTTLSVEPCYHNSMKHWNGIKPYQLHRPDCLGQQEITKGNGIFMARLLQG